MKLERGNMQKLMALITFAILLYMGLRNVSLVLATVRNILGLIAPFIIGGCLAFVLGVPMRFFETHLFNGRRGSAFKGKRILSILITFAAVCGVVAVVTLMVVPELYKSVVAIGHEISQTIRQVPEMLDMVAEKLPVFADELASVKDDFLNVDWKSLGAQAADFLDRVNFFSNTLSFASSVMGAVADIVIGLVFAIYILLQKENLSRQFRRLFYSFLPEKWVDRFLDVARLTASSFNSFLSGQCIEAFILGFMFFVSMWLLRLPYALAISVLIGVSALIPIFGAFIGCVIGALLILMVNPVKTLWFLILFLVLQQIEGNIIYPRVVGSSVGLPSIWVFVAVTFGASVGGIMGLLFAIPLCSVAYALLREAIRSRMEERDIDPEKIK